MYILGALEVVLGHSIICLQQESFHLIPTSFHVKVKFKADITVKWSNKK